MKTFSVQILGCKVNQYEGEQLAALLRSRGLRPAPAGGEDRADLRVIHTCSVTVQAAAKSRQLARRAGRDAGKSDAGKTVVSLPQFRPPRHESSVGAAGGGRSGGSAPAVCEAASGGTAGHGSTAPPTSVLRRPRVVVTGCWATSDPSEAAALPGVDAVIGHRQDVAAELSRLLDRWQGGDDGWIDQAGSPVGDLAEWITPSAPELVNGKIRGSQPRSAGGTTSLPLLSERQPGRQRAHLKVQDGCDAHCTYCIIPRLRPAPWSKPINDAVAEAQRLVAAGHVELVLTGIFLGAYGRQTAIRRRRAHEQAGSAAPLARLVDALCGRVTGLRRLRFSSLEPGDLTDDLVAALRSHPQVVPHLHLPLQSGSDTLLRRMNRQYSRDDYLRMVERVRSAFDRPALTTDAIVGFPGETDAEFERTMEVVELARFIHVHAFPFSPRPGTAAARWTDRFVRGPVVGERIERLRRRADAHGLDFRRQFVGETVQLLVERDDEDPAVPHRALRHGRCERYFAVHFDAPSARPGDLLRVRIESVCGGQTFGSLARMFHHGDTEDTEKARRCRT